MGWAVTMPQLLDAILADWREREVTGMVQIHIKNGRLVRMVPSPSIAVDDRDCSHERHRQGDGQPRDLAF